MKSTKPSPMPDLSPSITSLLEDLLSRLQTLLSSNLVGLYLRGSLATGDFEPDRSDVDLLVVLDHPVDEVQFQQLKDLHDQIANLDNAYAKRLEIAYIDRAGIRKFQPGREYPTLGQGEELGWQEHGTNWLMERWMVREHGIPLFGPDPETLIDPINPAEIKAAAVERLQDWAVWAEDESDPDWQLPRSHKAYAVETICRGLYTVGHGRLVSKHEAVNWALKAIPKPWRDLVNRSRAWRRDSTLDPSLIPEVRAFILWAAETALAGASNQTSGDHLTQGASS